MLKKSLAAVTAIAVALAFSPIPQLGAATLLGPGSKVQVEDSIEQAHMKKKKKAGKKKSKAGKCGTFMYYNKKAKKCLDARNKR